MKKYVYKAKCPYCKTDMKYTEDTKMEKLGWISFICPNENCLGRDGFLIPENSKIITKEEVKMSEKDIICSDVLFTAYLVLKPYYIDAVIQEMLKEVRDLLEKEDVLNYLKCYKYKIKYDRDNNALIIDFEDYKSVKFIIKFYVVENDKCFPLNYFVDIIPQITSIKQKIITL